MTQEEIKQAAEKFSHRWDAQHAYITGASSLIPEIEKLKSENKLMKEALEEINRPFSLLTNNPEYLKNIASEALSKLNGEDETKVRSSKIQNRKQHLRLRHEKKFAGNRTSKSF